MAFKTFSEQEFETLLQKSYKLKQQLERNGKKISRSILETELKLARNTAGTIINIIKYAPIITAQTENKLELRKTLSNAREFKKDNEQYLIEIEELRKELDLFYALKNCDIDETYRIAKPKSTKSEAIAISTLCDGHVDEVVDPNTVNGINKYNPDEAQRRIENYFKNLITVTNTQRTSVTIKKLIMGILGDMISGYIHEELRENNSMSPIQGSTFAKELIINGIKYIVENGNFDEIVIPLVRGNHSRTTQKKSFSTGYKNSYEWGLHNDLVFYFKDRPEYKHVKFVMSESEFVYVDAYDKKLRFSHGDHFKYRGGVGGIHIPLMLWLYRINKIINADMSFIGHWHTNLSPTENCRMGGSVVGYNAFAMGCGIAPQEPMMQFQLLDSQRGFTVNTPIFCTRN